MAGSSSNSNNTLSQQLNNYLQILRDQGILDDNFNRVKRLQNKENPCFVTDIISTFKRDAEVGIAFINKNLKSDAPDYARTITTVHMLKSSSSSVGGHRMAHACKELRLACDSSDKARCFEKLDKVIQEYNTIRECLNIIVQMEKSILANETCGSGGGRNL